MNIIVLDNFLPYPDIVRNWSLYQEYYNCEEYSELVGEKNTWPGKRTENVNVLDESYANVVLTNICNIVRNCFNLHHNLEVKSSFQLTLKEDGESWIHMDNDVLVAGVLYLTPNPPTNSGTTLYSNPPHVPTDTIGNVYNRLILYKADIFHKSTNYFGKTKEDGRLTQVIFIK